VLSIINEVSLSVAKCINRRVPLWAVLRIYYGAGNEGDFYLKPFSGTPHRVLCLHFKRIRIPIRILYDSDHSR